MKKGHTPVKKDTVCKPRLKRPSYFIEAVLRALEKEGCVCCGKPPGSCEKSVRYFYRGGCYETA